MRTSMVCISKRWQMEASSLMSDYMEIINPQTRIARLYYQGEVVEEYKVEQCDKCSILTRFDAFGYQKGYGGEKIIWFCVGCR